MPQTRLGDRSLVPCDTHGRICCPHCCIGPAITGSPNVFVNMRPAVRVTDRGVHAACCGPNTWVAVLGSTTVLINNLQAHRLLDLDAHCGGPGYMVDGSPNVLVGETSVASAAPTVGALKLKMFPAETPVPPGAAPKEGKPPTPSPDQGPKQTPPGSTSDWEQQLRQCAPTPVLIREEAAPKRAFQQESRQPPPAARDLPSQGVEAEGKGFFSGLWDGIRAVADFLGGVLDGLWGGLKDLVSALLSPVTWLIIAAVAGLVIAGVVSLTAVATAGLVLLGIAVIVGLVSVFMPGLSTPERGRRFGGVLFEILLIPLGAGFARLLRSFKPLARLGAFLKGSATKVMNKLRGAGAWLKGLKNAVTSKLSGAWQRAKAIFKSRRQGPVKPLQEPVVRPAPLAEPAPKVEAPTQPIREPKPRKAKKPKQPQQPRPVEGPPRPCFLAGTLVETIVGPRPIEAVAEGDFVRAREAGSSRPSGAFRVVWTRKARTRTVVRIEVGGGVIEATPGHPFAVAGVGWVPARELRPEDYLELQGGGSIPVDAVTTVWLTAPARTYNLTVDTVSAYCVCLPTGSVLVHNTDLSFWNQTIYWLYSPTPELRKTDVDGKSFWRTDSVEEARAFAKQRLVEGQTGNHGYYTKEQFEAMLGKNGLRACYTPPEEPLVKGMDLRHYSVRRPETVPVDYVEGTRPPDLSETEMADLAPKVKQMEPSGKLTFDPKVCD